MGASLPTSRRDGARRAIRSVLLVVLGLVAGLTCWSGAYGAPAKAGTPGGPSGGLRIPTSEVLGPGRLKLSVYEDEESIARGSLLSVGYGVAQGVEVGLVAPLEHEGDLTPFGKVGFAPAWAPGTALAAGVSGSSPFVVASHYVGPADLTLHAGVGDNRYDGLFLGFEKVLNPVAVRRAGTLGPPLVSLTVEYLREAVAAGVELEFAPALAASLGVETGGSVLAGVEFSTRF